MFDFANLQRIATAAVGALFLSAACVGAAVAPAHGLRAESPSQAVDASNQA